MTTSLEKLSRPASFSSLFFLFSLYVLALACLLSEVDIFLFGQIFQSLIIVWILIGLGKLILSFKKKKDK